MEQYIVHAPESIRAEIGACSICCRIRIAMHVYNSPVEINRKYDLHPCPVWRADTTNQLLNCVSCGCDSVYKSSHPTLGEDGVWPWRENIKNSATGSCQKTICWHWYTEAICNCDYPRSKVRETYHLSLVFHCLSVLGQLPLCLKYVIMLFLCLIWRVQIYY